MAAALENQSPLQCAYLLKEEWGELWQQDDGRKAWAFLREWAAKAPSAESVNSRPWQKPSSARQGNPKLLPHRFDQRKDGRNQSQDSRAARQRFRDDDFLKLRLYALHKAKFTLVG
jgi:hypothetical protein